MISLFLFQEEDGIRDIGVTGVQTCALPIWNRLDQPTAVRPRAPPDDRRSLIPDGRRRLAHPRDRLEVRRRALLGHEHVARGPLELADSRDRRIRATAALTLRPRHFVAACSAPGLHNVPSSA